MYKILINFWLKDERFKRIGVLELIYYRDGIMNVFVWGYKDIFGGDEIYFQVLMVRVRNEVVDCNMYSWVFQ